MVIIYLFLCTYITKQLEFENDITTVSHCNRSDHIKYVCTECPKIVVNFSLSCISSLSRGSGSSYFHSGFIVEPKYRDIFGASNT